MAQGEGGGGHFDERRRARLAKAAKPKKVSYAADSEDVLSLIRKPKKVAVAKPRAKPSRVKVESHDGAIPEMVTPPIPRPKPGRLQVESSSPVGTKSDRAPEFRMGNWAGGQMSGASRGFDFLEKLGLRRPTSPSLLSDPSPIKPEPGMPTLPDVRYAMRRARGYR